MKTYKQFIVEAKPPKPDALQTIGDNLRKRTPGMKFIATKDRIGDIRLNSIEVPKEKRGEAPITANFDTALQASQYRALMLSKTQGAKPSMPPGQLLKTKEKEAFAEWLKCGTPQKNSQ